MDISLEGSDLIEDLGDEAEKVARLFRRIELPNYIMNLTSINIKQYADEGNFEAILNNVFPAIKYGKYNTFFLAARLNMAHVWALCNLVDVQIITRKVKWV